MSPLFRALPCAALSFSLLPLLSLSLRNSLAFSNSRLPPPSLSNSSPSPALSLSYFRFNELSLPFKFSLIVTLSHTLSHCSALPLLYRLHFNTPHPFNRPFFFFLNSTRVFRFPLPVPEFASSVLLPFLDTPTLLSATFSRYILFPHSLCLSFTVSYSLVFTLSLPHFFSFSSFILAHGLHSLPLILRLSLTLSLFQRHPSFPILSLKLYLTPPPILDQTCSTSPLLSPLSFRLITHSGSPSSFPLLFRTLSHSVFFVPSLSVLFSHHLSCSPCFCFFFTLGFLSFLCSHLSSLSPPLNSAQPCLLYTKLQ